MLVKIHSMTIYSRYNFVFNPHYALFLIMKQRELDIDLINDEIEDSTHQSAKGFSTNALDGVTRGCITWCIVWLNSWLVA